MAVEAMEWALLGGLWRNEKKRGESGEAVMMIIGSWE